MFTSPKLERGRTVRPTCHSIPKFCNSLLGKPSQAIRFSAAELEAMPGVSFHAEPCVCAGKDPGCLECAGAGGRAVAAA